MTFRTSSAWLGGNGVAAPHDRPRLVLSERPPAAGWHDDQATLDQATSDTVTSNTVTSDTAPPVATTSDVDLVATTDTRPRHVRLPMGTSHHPVKVARRAVRGHCVGRVPDAVIDDLLIVVSELVANVLEHGGGSNGLTLELTIRATEVDIQVIGHGDRRHLPPSGDWRLPPPTQRTGRGLALVRRLARWVTVDGDDPVREQDGWIAITAALPISAV